MDSRHTALLTGPETYLDHLGVLSYVLDIPLIITEEETYKACRTFYPQVRSIKKELSDLSLDFLAQNFDALFQSAKFWNCELKPMLHLLYKKSPRFIFCPHGNSDKGHSLKFHVDQDISLVYGDHMLDLLKKTGALEKIGKTIHTGNYRLQFYRQHQKQYETLFEEKIQKHLDPSKKTILYAPTWHDGENPSSFFHSALQAAESLSPTFNFILKLHPFLEQFHPAHTHHVIGLCEEIPNACVLQNFPAIYPILQAVDIYLGDYSSIGYDFLAFDKPLYFLVDNPAQENLLHSCGMAIPDPKKSREFIERTLEKNTTEKQSNRKALYRYAFGEEKPLSVLKKEIFSSLN